MKKLKRVSVTIISVLLLTMVITLLLPNVNSDSTVSASSIKINKTKITLNVGKTYNLKISGATKTVKWSTGNRLVATVTSSGKVTAKNKGTTTITATVGGKKYSCKVTVSKKYKNGVFEGTGTGYRNGTTTVSVTISNDIITNIKVVSNEDTPRFFNSASSEVISEIIDSQSANVDAVSGATYSSNGIMEAVDNALNKAKY